MHRDVKPHNVMIDHEHRKVLSYMLTIFLMVTSAVVTKLGETLIANYLLCYIVSFNFLIMYFEKYTHLNFLKLPASSNRLGFGRILPPKPGIQCESGIQVL